MTEKSLLSIELLKLEEKLFAFLINKIYLMV